MHYILIGIYNIHAIPRYEIHVKITTSILIIGVKWTGKGLHATVSGYMSDWKESHQLSDSLMPLDVIGDHFRAPLKPLDTIVAWCSMGFRGPANRAFMMLRWLYSCMSVRCNNSKPCKLSQDLFFEMSMIYGGSFSWFSRSKTRINFCVKSFITILFP